MPATFDQAFHDVRTEAFRTVGPERLKELHRRSGRRHALVALLPALALAGGGFLAVTRGGTPALWAPGAVLAGLAVFAFTTLLHEVVHRNVFSRRRPRAEKTLAFVYALLCGLSPSQFARWHLDHHRWLGTTAEDPKRAHLSPKRNSRALKLLYVTPWLFPLYFRAARRAAAGYEEPLRRRIRRERRAAILFHLGLASTLLVLGGAGVLVRGYVIPVFFVFPVAFTLNRLGQHYDVDPADPARWGTLLRPSPFRLDLVFLFSNYHLEHHYFPHVPCYRLPALRRALDPFFGARGVPARTLPGLVVDWFVRNRPPHVRWTGAAGESCAREDGYTAAPELP